MRDERSILGVIRDAADGGHLRDGGHQRWGVLLCGVDPMPDGRTGGLSGKPADGGAADPLCGGGSGAGPLDHAAGDPAGHRLRGGEYFILPRAAKDREAGGAAAAEPIRTGAGGRCAGDRTDAAGRQHQLQWRRDGDGGACRERRCGAVGVALEAAVYRGDHRVWL